MVVWGEWLLCGTILEDVNDAGDLLKYYASQE